MQIENCWSDKLFYSSEGNFAASLGAFSKVSSSQCGKFV